MSNETCPRCGAKKKNTFYDSRYECDGVASISEKCHVRSMENLKAANSKEHKILGKNPTLVLIDEVANNPSKFALFRRFCLLFKEISDKKISASDKSSCNPHPNAPHGFNRTASHNEGRYVCDCEYWKEDQE